MTPRERAEQVQWVGKTPAELWLEIEEIIIAAVEEEREACAKILDNADVESYCGFQIAELARLIRARSAASEGEIK